MMRFRSRCGAIVAALVVYLAGGVGGCAAPPEPASPESRPRAPAPPKMVAAPREPAVPKAPAPPLEPAVPKAPVPPREPVEPAPARESRPQNVILFGWDGAQRDHVNECLQRGELPTLQRFVDERAYVEIDIEGTTDTKAGWSQILTGYYPEVTGVYSNRRYQSIPEGLSIGERLEKHFGPEDVVTLAVIGKKNHVDADPPKKLRIAERAGEPGAKKKRRKGRGKIVEEDGVKYRLIPGKPHYHMSQNTDLFVNGLMKDEKVGRRAIELIEKHKDRRFFMFVHFAEVDHSGHKHGENSKEYNDALISNDAWTGKIMDKVKELGLADKTQYYITADHGFDEGGKSHKMAPYIFLAGSDGKISRNGRRQDVAPTILEAFGLDLSKIEPPLDGIPLTKPDNRPPAKIGRRKKARKERGRPRRKPVKVEVGE